MLSLSTRYRRLLWQRDDWSQVLCEEAARCAAAGAETVGVDALVELAVLCESIVPDVTVALDLYCRAYARDGQKQWADKGYELALELGDFLSIARIAAMQYERTGDVFHLRQQANALFDAGDIASALVPLNAVLQAHPDDQHLIELRRAAIGELQDASKYIDSLVSLAEELPGQEDYSGLLLIAARLSRLCPGAASAEELLMQAFHADPTNLIAYSLLENDWVERRKWKRLSNLHRVRTQRGESPYAEVHSCRVAGTRLVLRSDSPGTGVRLLQHAIATLYKQDMEEVPQLVALLGLLTDQLVHAGGTPSAIRLLAQGLAHPRTDDEAIWIVNRGLELAGDDPTLRRTVANFELLRERLLAHEPALLAETAAAEIGGEVEEHNHPSGLGPEVAERTHVVADVNIAVRAELSTDRGKAFAMTRDVSETGLFLACDAELAVDAPVALSILLPGEDEWSLTEHELAGVVARVEPGVGYGVRFTKVTEQFLSDIRALTQ